MAGCDIVIDLLFALEFFRVFVTAIERPDGRLTVAWREIAATVLKTRRLEGVCARARRVCMALRSGASRACMRAMRAVFLDAICAIPWAVVCLAARLDVYHPVRLFVYLRLMHLQRTSRSDGAADRPPCHTHARTHARARVPRRVRACVRRLG